MHQTHNNYIKYSKYLINIIILITLSGCSQTPPEVSMKQEPSTFSRKNLQNKLTQWLKPYKIEVQQGNVLAKEQVTQLKPGLTKTQVRTLLGTPVFSESLAKNDWIYLYTEARDGQISKKQNLILSFSNDKLKNIKEETTIG